MSDKTYNVLALCTGNSARSILAEAIINREGAGKFRGFSAGSQPKGEPNPIALEFLQSLGYDTSYHRSKSWTEFSGPNAPNMDIIITLALIYCGYRVWKWYDGLKAQVGPGPGPNMKIRTDQDPDIIDIDYEEID